MIAVERESCAVERHPRERKLYRSELGGPIGPLGAVPHSVRIGRHGKIRGPISFSYFFFLFDASISSFFGRKSDGLGLIGMDGPSFQRDTAALADRWVFDYRYQTSRPLVIRWISLFGKESRGERGFFSIWISIYR